MPKDTTLTIITALGIISFGFSLANTENPKISGYAGDAYATWNWVGWFMIVCAIYMLGVVAYEWGKYYKNKYDKEKGKKTDHFEK